MGCQIGVTRLNHEGGGGALLHKHTEEEAVLGAQFTKRSSGPFPVRSGLHILIASCIDNAPSSNFISLLTSQQS